MPLSKLSRVVFCFVVGLLLCVEGAAQSTIPAVQFTTSFSYLNTATDSINQRGFEMSGGYNTLKWLTLGADFAHYSGSGGRQTALPAIPGLPSSITVPFDTDTYTMAAGAKFLLRRNKWVIPYVRPGLGLVHETATPQLPSGLPITLPVPGPTGEWRAFYGIGGGFEVHHIVPHAAIIVVSDYLHSRLFGQNMNSYRISAGLSALIGSHQVR